MSLLDSVLGRNSSHVSHKLKGSARIAGESFDDYKERRRREQKLLDSYLRGDLVWCSKAFKRTNLGVDEHGLPITVQTIDKQKSKGTYVKSEHGRVTSPRRVQ